MLIAQISDPHVRPRGHLYEGLVDSNTMFAAAIAHLATLSTQPDVVVLTGDVVDRGLAAEYDRARELLAHLSLPLFVLPGNHDEREGFRRAFADHAYLPASGPLHFVTEDAGPVRIVGLDVTVPGHHHGLMDEAAAEWLEAVLARAPDRPTLLLMHQPPFITGVPYLDAYLCRDGHRLASLIARYPNVQCIACGHVHRFMALRFAGTLLCTAPSTTTAIALRFDPQAAPASHIEPPGLLLHRWTPDTGIVSHLVPIGAFPGPLPIG